MISTKWFQFEGLEDCLKIREIVFQEEMGLGCDYIKDNYDEYGKIVVAYNDRKPVGTARLISKQGEFYLDKLCVIKEERKQGCGELLIRMIVRKAIDMGGEKVFAEIKENNLHLFEKVGFVVENRSNNSILVVKNGDVGCSCGKE